MANAFDSASIVQIPSGYKASTLYSIVPSSGAGDFSVSRAGATATRVNSSGLIESVAANVPRIDWAEGGSCPSLLVEPQRTNIFIHSDPASDPGVGNRTNITFAANDWSIGLNGKVVYGDNSVVRAYYQSTVSASTQYSFSFFIKPDNGIEPTFGTAGSDICRVSLGGDNITSGYTVSLFATGIWKVTVTATSGTTNLGNNGLLKSSANNAVGFEASGFQLEQASYVTSYIPTTATAETRNADVISKTAIASLLGDSEGTVFFEASVFDNSVSNRISLSDGSTNNRFTFALSSSITNFTVVGGVSEASPSGGTISNNTYTKIAGRYSVNDFALYQDGSSVATDTSGSTFSDGTLTDIYFANGSGGGLFFYGRIRSLAVYDIALTNTELQNITT